MGARDVPPAAGPAAAAPAAAASGKPLPRLRLAPCRPGPRPRHPAAMAGRHLVAQRRRRPLQRLLAAAMVCLLGLAARAGGMEYINDELLWMKAHWQDYKLAFPWSAALRQRDVEGTRQLQVGGCWHVHPAGAGCGAHGSLPLRATCGCTPAAPEAPARCRCAAYVQGPLAGFPVNSMNGPAMDEAVLGYRIDEDTRRCTSETSAGKQSARRTRQGRAPAWGSQRPGGGRRRRAASAAAARYPGMLTREVSPFAPSPPSSQGLDAAQQLGPHSVG